MFFSARQLEQLHRSNGHVTLPYRARLTPLAKDWLKRSGVTVGYSDDAFKQETGAVVQAAAGMPGETATDDAKPSGPVLWWCDGACGGAKAALIAASKESPLLPIDIAADAKKIVAAIKHVAAAIKAGKASGGVLIVTHGAAAMLLANRCPSLRAVLGTCLESVDQGVKEIAANVLVIEHPHKTFPQVKNLLSRFLRGKRELGEDLKRQLAELSSCA